MSYLSKMQSEEKLKFYSEIGQFFASNGSFNSEVFEQSFNAYIGSLKNGNKNAIQSKISEYISDILTHLQEKNLPEAARLLYYSAINVVHNNEISDISFSSTHISFILESQNTDIKKQDRDKDTETKIRNIYSAALRIFDEEGFRKSTMDGIAVQAGIGKGSVYRLFKNKEEINAISSEKSDVTEQIKSLIAYWIGYIAENHAIYKLIQTESNSEGIHNKIIFYDYLSSNLPLLKEKIVSQNLQKRLKTINFYTAFYGILGYIDGVVIKWLRSNRSYNLNDEIPEIIDVLFSGFVE